MPRSNQKKRRSQIHGRKNSMSSSNSYMNATALNNRGVRGERLNGDGKTFTSLTALPRTVTPNPMVYRCVQSYESVGFFSTSVSLPTFFSLRVELDTFDQYASFTALFDQYKIESVEMWIMPQQSDASNVYGGMLNSVIDLDDNNLLTTVAQASDYTSCVTSEATQGHYRHFTPHVAVNLYAGAFGAFGNSKPMWIDAASPNVQHYGVKLACTPTTNIITYDLRVRCVLAFRSVR